MTPFFFLVRIAAVFIISFICFSARNIEAGTYTDNSLAELNILKKSILAFNAVEYRETVGKGSYRGNEGCLMMDPITGRTLGLKTIVTEDYTRAKALFDEADRALALGIDTMNAAGGDSASEHMVKLLYDYSCDYRKALSEAAKHIEDYRKALKKEHDERLDENACSALLDRLLKDCIAKAGGNLRDSLGCFYNVSRGINDGAGYLSTKNISFVNQVFRQYIDSVGNAALNPLFDLDRQHSTSELAERWERAKEKIKNPYLEYVDEVFKKGLSTGTVVDPLLFLALIRQESNFNAIAVSHVGAAGLTQIMPLTAKSLGMRQVHMPDYYEDARKFFVKETELRREAISLFRRICAGEWDKIARDALRRMQESNSYKSRRTELYGRYKAELAAGVRDDRLDPKKAISYGFTYFGGILKEQAGDISLALAGYNAGPHRVKQFIGLPPYSETVSFRNNVLRFYREYLAASK